MKTDELGISGLVIREIEDVHKTGALKKAGIWQATTLFKDHEMFVRRNVRFTLDLGGIDLATAFNPDLPWAEDHFIERVSGEPTNPGETYRYWPYATFNKDNDPYQDGKVFSHTYQERFWPKHAGPRPIRRQIEKDPSIFEGYANHKGIRYELGDLNDVITQLRDNPLTRQAWLPIFFPEDTGAVHGQRVPCTLGYYFWIEDGTLNCNYIIRSCDVLRHFRNDLYLTGRLLQFVASNLNLKVGELDFFCFNLHLFKNDLFALKKKELAIWKTLAIE